MELSPNKRKTQPHSKAVFIRMDTVGGKPLLEKRACIELVTTFLFNFRQQQWFNLIGFVVLPRELQLIVVPRSFTVIALVSRIEKETTPFLCALTGSESPIWDAEFYSEPLDGIEAIRSRLRAMQAAPVKLRLSAAPDLYDFSSANPIYRADLDKLETQT